MSKITEALSKLDPSNDNHWTQDGLPRLDTVKILAGDPSLTREAVTAAAPDFNRGTAQGAPQGGAGTPVQGGAAPAPQGAPQAAQPGDDAATLPGAADPELPNLNPAPLAEQSYDAEDMAARIAEAKLQLSDAMERLHLAKQEVADAQNALAELEAALQESAPANSNPIAAYLQSQRKKLEERAARKELIRESGIDLGELAKNLKSPLDAAMERRRGRGGRPNRG